MNILNLKINSPKKILALGAELDTTMACCVGDKIFVSENLEDTNNTPGKLEEKITNFLQECHVDQPDYILTDLHPEYNSVKTGAKLAEKWQIPHLKIQHHEAHIFSSIVEHYLEAPLLRGVRGFSPTTSQIPLTTTEDDCRFPLLTTTEDDRRLPPLAGGAGGVRRKISQTLNLLPNQIIGIACDGTGYGHDGDIWGGEIIQINFNHRTSPPDKGGWGVLLGNEKNFQLPIHSISSGQVFNFQTTRIGHLEPQTLLGGQLAVEEPARVLMAILAKFLDEQELYSVMEKFYDQKILKLFNSQLKQNFNCQPTTSCGRILDASSALLFGCNERKYKHQAAKILEENSSEAYDDIEPVILHGTWNMEHGTDAINGIKKTNETPQPPLSGGLSELPANSVSSSEWLSKTSANLDFSSRSEIRTSPPDKGGWGVLSGNAQIPQTNQPNKNFQPSSPPRRGGWGGASAKPQILQTTPLFQYLIKNLHKDKHRLSATVHKYIADGLFKIANNCQNRFVEVQPPNWRLDLYKPTPIIFTGGFANNQVFRKYFENKNVLINKKVPSGDPGIAVGQIGWFLLQNI